MNAINPHQNSYMRTWPFVSFLVPVRPHGVRAAQGPEAAEELRAQLPRPRDVGDVPDTALPHGVQTAERVRQRSDGRQRRMPDDGNGPGRGGVQRELGARAELHERREHPSDGRPGGVQHQGLRVARAGAALPDARLVRRAERGAVEVGAVVPGLSAVPSHLGVPLTTVQQQVQARARVEVHLPAHFSRLPHRAALPDRCGAVAPLGDRPLPPLVRDRSARLGRRVAARRDHHHPGTQRLRLDPAVRRRSRAVCRLAAPHRASLRRRRARPGCFRQKPVPGRGAGPLHHAAVPVLVNPSLVRPVGHYNRALDGRCPPVLHHLLSVCGQLCAAAFGRLQTSV